MMLGSFLSDKWGPIMIAWWLLAGLCALGLLFTLGNAVLNRRYQPTDGLVQGVVGRMGSGKSLFLVQRVLLPYCRSLSKRGFVLTSGTYRRMTRVVANFTFNPGVANVEVRNVMPGADTSIFDAIIDLAYEIGAVEGPWRDAAGILQDGRKPIPEGCDPVLLDNGEMAYVRQPILNGLVLLDEMHLYANSSNVALGQSASWLISMARKLNAEIWWVSQHEMKVHKRLRDESSSIWLAGKLQGIAGFFIGGHCAREYQSPVMVERARSAFGSGSAPRPTDRRYYRYSKAVGRVYNSFELLTADPVRGVQGAKRSGARSDPAAVPADS